MRIEQALCAHDQSQYLLKCLVSQSPHFVVGAVLDGMRDVDDAGLEAERLGLRLTCFHEHRRGDVAAGNAFVVEGLDVVQTARCARASIGQAFDHEVDLVGDLLR